MTSLFEDLPLPDDKTKVTVALPARHEAATLRATLDAFASQVDARGRPLPARAFDVIVFANSCRDATATIARTFAREHPFIPVHVVEADLPQGAEHVGTARGAAMDAAAERFLRRNRSDGIVATTDADSIVDPDWVSATVAEFSCIDAVTGRIELLPADLAAMSARSRIRYELDDEYHALVANLEAIRDPVAYDPLPRHAQHFGASFAVSALAYRRAGGLPRVPRMEDIALYGALHRIDARVRHSPQVRVRTSARTIARVVGGLATRLDEYENPGANALAHVAEAPEYTIARIDGRAALRAVWNGTSGAHDLHRVLATYGITVQRFRQLFEETEPFGANAQRLERHGDRAFMHPPMVPIGNAIASLARVCEDAGVGTVVTTDTSKSPYETKRENLTIFGDICERLHR